jgi:hypothetical protein
VWALLVVFDHPPVCCISDLSQVPEQVKVKKLVSIGSVKPFDVSVLIRFTGQMVTGQIAGV